MNCTVEQLENLKELFFNLANGAKTPGGMDESQHGMLAALTGQRLSGNKYNYYSSLRSLNTVSAIGKIK